ncbi:MAG: metallopeptidase family protein [Planctomycetota bacterium]
MPHVVSQADFDALVEQGIRLLPPRFANALADVRVEVRDRPSEKLLRDMEMHPDDLLLGLYEGIPLTERSVEESGRAPDVIFLFRDDIMEVARDENDLVEQVTITLLHEIGHYFGLDEDELDRLGYG